MVLINKAINEVTVKLVYYGPGLCGKTTNLEKIYANPKLDHKGKMISMSTETDRTLFFDFMPMELGTIAGQKVRVQLYTVPGQVFYDATRKLVLRGADGVVFVADSQESMKESNLDSLENLKTNLRINRLDPDKVAIVFQYNKRDLPNVSSVEEMNAYLKPGNAPVVEAAAIQGQGVTATLRAAITRILDNLKNNVDVTLYEQPPLSAPDLSQKSGVAAHSAGTPKLAVATGASAPSAGAPPRAVAPAPVPPPDAPASSPFGVAAVPDAAPFEEAEPFDAVEAHVDFEDPFAAPVVETVEPQGFEPEASASPELSVSEVAPDELLASARAAVEALEAALERAREHERALIARLG